jgi:hypothetical protein
MMSSVVTRLLPDLDDELTHALAQLEELPVGLARLVAGQPRARRERAWASR